MYSLRFGSDLDCSPGQTRHPSPAIPGAVLGLLVLLSMWDVGEQLSDTAVPSLLHVVPYAGISPDVAFFLAGLVLIARGWRTDRGWALIGLGTLCWASGDVYWQLKLASMSSPPVPSWADAGYLSFCPLAFSGILSLVRGKARNTPGPLIADAAAAALATGAVSAALVVEPVITHASGGAAAIATNLAYPICDLSLLGLLIGAMAVGEWRPNRKLIVLGLAVLAFWIADSAYLVAVATNTYSQTQWYNGLWYLSPVLAAWAGWLPDRRQTAAAVLRGTSARGIVMLLGFAATALAVLCASSVTEVGLVAVGLASLAILVILARLVMTWQENVRLLHDSRREAITDSLTGLRNRRALTADLRAVIAAARPEQPVALVLFDLDGFKHYNDDFGHPAGDALLQRLGDNLSAHLRGRGTAYRMGGDEFCALVHTSEDQLQPTVGAAAAALAEAGEGFTISCSYGSVILPQEAETAADALRLADLRMYAQKRGGRASASRQSTAVLLRALEERNPSLHTHLRDVGELAAETARGFGLAPDEVEEIRQAAELHDVGKVAVPDAILDKPAALDEGEWAFIRRHTLIGERIITAAPALMKVGALVRSSHESFDGTGYPDRLRGEEIPLGARIISVCDAFDAMTTDRAYRTAMSVESALAELRRCAGTQFDPGVVDRFCLAVDRERVAQPA
jgi:diguanylate cyclase (GGDEF)-like protein